MNIPMFPYGRRRHVPAVASAGALVIEGLTAGYPGRTNPQYAMSL